MTLFELLGVISIRNKEANDALRNTQNEVHDTANAMEGAGNSGSNMGAKLGKALKVVGAIATAAMGATAAAIKSAAATGQEFDASMSQVAATMGYSMDELQDSTTYAAQTFDTLRAFAQKMGAETAFSATQAADALNYMALAGYDAETSMEMLPTVLNLAAAGGIELAQASDMVTDAASALGLSLDETSAMVDQMAKASSKSNTSVAQLGEAFLTIGANAQNLAGGTVELSTALGILANSGIKGAEGGTHLRNVLLSLQAPTDVGAAAIRDLGVDVYDANKNLRPMNDILTDLNAAMADMNSQERTNMISQIFNKTDLASVNALLAGAGQQWSNLASQIANSTDAAKDMAEVQLDNLAGDVTLFNSALDGVKIAISDKVTPTMREFVQLGTTGLSEIATALNGPNGIDNAADAVGNTIKAAVVKIGEVLPDIVTIGGAIVAALMDGIIAVLPAIGETAINLVLTLTEKIIEMLPDLVDTGITLITSLIDSITGALPTLIPAIVNALTAMITSIVDHIPDFINGGLQLLLGLAEGIVQALPTLVEMIPEIIIQVYDTVIEALPTIIDTGVQILLALIDGIVQAIPVLVSYLPTIIGKMVQYLTGALPQIIAAGIQILLALINGIIECIPVLVAMIPDIILSIVEGIIAALPEIINAGIEVLTALIDGIVEAIPMLMEMLPTIIATVVNVLVEHLPEIIESGLTILVALINGLINALPQLMRMVPQIIWTIITTLIGLLPDILNMGMEILSNLISGISDKIKELPEKGREIINKVKEGIQEKIDQAKTWGKDLLDNFINGIKEKIQKLKNTVTSIGNTIKSLIGFSEPEEGPLSNFHTYAPDMMDLFAQGIKDNEGVITEQVEKSFNIKPTIEALDGNLLSTESLTASVKTDTSAQQQADVTAVNFNRLIQLLNDYFPEIINNMQREFVFEDGAMAAHLAPAMDASLGNINRLRARGL